MYTFQRIAGSLDGIFDFTGYWNALKNKIKELQGLGFHISTYQQRLGVAHTRLTAKGRPDLAAVLDDEIRKAQNDLDKWWKVKGYIDRYLPEWMMIDKGASASPSGLGVVPLALSGMAIAGLTYVVTTGLALLQDYSFKKGLTEAVIEGKVTSGQAAEILSVPKEKGVFERVTENVGTTVGIGLPVILLIGGGVYFAMTTGMLKGVLGSRSEGSS
jgi:hypothetical protein